MRAETQAEGHSVTAAAGGRGMGDTETQERGVTEVLGGVGPGWGAGQTTLREGTSQPEPDGAPEPVEPVLPPWAPVRGARQGRPLCSRGGPHAVTHVPKEV